ncbi:hypothetical protein ACFSZS_31985, partial [Seohaeicola zhoushanensis]
MSGFFAVRKSDFDQARDLNPIGYKIALEIIVKCDLENIGEVPIHFVDRARGKQAHLQGTAEIHTARPAPVSLSFRQRDVPAAVPGGRRLRHGGQPGHALGAPVHRDG